jgi:hypothetical protein
VKISFKSLHAGSTYYVIFELEQFWVKIFPFMNLKKIISRMEEFQK